MSIITSALGIMDRPTPRPAGVRVVDIESMASASMFPIQPVNGGLWDGEKFPGGYGPTTILTTDYWTLRQRSGELFSRSLHAAGLIRRLVTNVVNLGLSLEAVPNGRILGIPDEDLTDWTEDVEARFEIWAADARVIDLRKEENFGGLQRASYREAMIVGDVLVILRRSNIGLPQVELIPGGRVQTPYGMTPATGNKITHGVETDSTGSPVAYWVTQDNGKAIKVPAYGEKTGRRISWLVFGSDRRMDEVRGVPILGLALQSLKELDRYRDATIRKAVLNSMLAILVTRENNTPGSRPLTTQAAVRRDHESGNIGPSGESRVYNINQMVPGVMIENLQAGEEPHGFKSDGVDEKFGEMERAIVAVIAWANEIPPSSLMLSFSSNYSASRAETNEFKLFLEKERNRFAESFCARIYREWFVAMVGQRRIVAPGVLESWRRLDGYEIFGAWSASDWNGAIKPAIDLLKEANGYAKLLAEGLITRDRAARDLSGMKFSRLVSRLKVENEMLADALVKLWGVAKQPASAGDVVPPEDDIEAIAEEAGARAAREVMAEANLDSGKNRG